MPCITLWILQVQKFCNFLRYAPDGDLLSLKELGGWESSTVAETYIEKSVSKRMKITNQLFHDSSKNNVSLVDTNICHSSVASSSSIKSVNPWEGLQISKNNKCTFNFHVHYHEK